MKSDKKNELVLNRTNLIDWINPKETKLFYGLSVSTLAKWRMENKYLPYFKIGKYIKYRRSDIEEFLENNIVNVYRINDEK